MDLAPRLVSPVLVEELWDFGRTKPKRLTFSEQANADRETGYLGAPAAASVNARGSAAFFAGCLGDVGLSHIPELTVVAADAIPGLALHIAGLNVVLEQLPRCLFLLAHPVRVRLREKRHPLAHR